MDKKTIAKAFIVTFIALSWISSAKTAYAISKPNFPSCLNPNADLIVSYSSGIHGVPGQTASYNGEDKVYKLSDGNVLQCLCTVNGDGVHTNWWKVSSLTDDELNSLKAEGWILIPDGSLWGLEKTTYMAQNIFYSCNGSSNGGSGSSSSSSSSSNNSSGQVQGITTRFGQVLGLATTGTLPVIVGYLTLGAILLLTSRQLKK